MIPLEDNFGDVISKAQRGLEISDSDLAKKARVDASAIRKLRGGNFDELALFRVAPVLGLGARALSDLAQNEYRPAAREIDGLAMFNTPFHDMRVNAFLVWVPKSRKAIAFDTGADCRSMLDRVAKEKLAVKLILLTHAHTDHIADLARLKINRCACLYFGARVHSRRRNDFRRSRIQCWQFEGESVANLGAFPRRNDILRYRTGPTGRHRRRFDFCRLNGRRKCVL